MNLLQKHWQIEEFRETLRNIKYEDGKTTILQRIVQTLLNF